MRWTIAKWTWRITTNIFYFLVVWYVLSQLRGRPEKVIVLILGLMYVTIRIIASGNVYIVTQFGTALDDINAKLGKLIDSQYERDAEEISEIKKTVQSIQLRSQIDVVGLSFIGLLCLWYLATAIDF